MNSIENGATIRMGLKECRLYNNHFEREITKTIPTYSLKINKRTIFSVAEHNYLGFNQNLIAKRIAENMKKHNVKNYVIYNGETLDKNKRWTCCTHFPEHVKDEFKNTLDEFLN